VRELIGETVRQPIAGQQNEIGVGRDQGRMLYSGYEQIVIRVLAVLPITRNLGTAEDARPFRRWRAHKRLEEFRIIERVEVKIRETQDNSDVRLLGITTGAGLGGGRASTGTTQEECKQYDYGSAHWVQSLGGNFVSTIYKAISQQKVAVL
jgi:hypothetical protein